MVKYYSFFTLLLIALTLFGCSNAPYRSLPQQDGAPKHFVDINTIPDAKPAYEPYSKYGNPPYYTVYNKRYYTQTSAVDHKETGVASWYGTKFHGRSTSSGEPYDMFAMTAAHKSLPLPTYAKVTNLENNRTVIVKINDRGPFHEERVIDLSYAAASKLGFADKGTAQVHIEAITFPQHSPASPTKLALESKQPVTRHYVQVGAFKNRQGAEALQDQLRDIHNSARITNLIEKENYLYKVRLGPFHSREEATQLASLVVDYGLQPFIVTE